jgi:hypothetical protein
MWGKKLIIMMKLPTPTILLTLCGILLRWSWVKTLKDKICKMAGMNPSVLND